MYSEEAKINVDNANVTHSNHFTAHVLSADTQLPQQQQYADRPFIQVQIGNAVFPALYDTGASCNIMSAAVFQAANTMGKVKGYLPRSGSITTASGEAVRIVGVYVVDTTVQGHPYTGPFTVLERTNVTQPIIIGMTAISSLQLQHDAKTNIVSVVNPQTQAIVLSVHKKAKAEPGQSTTVYVKASQDGRPLPNRLLAASVNLQDVLVETDDNGVFAVCLSNRTGQTTCWERRSSLGQAVIVSDDDYEVHQTADAADLQIAAADRASHVRTRLHRRAEANSPGQPPQEVRQTVQLATQHLPPALAGVAQHHLLSNWSAISKDKFDLGLCRLYQHTVHLSDKTPVYNRQFPIPLDHQDTILDNVKQWLQLGIVEPAKSPYNSPIFCVRKKGGGFRMCLDYRGVNAKSLPENYNIRTPDDCIAEVGQKGGKYFIALDLSSGFYQMEMAPQSRPISAFTVPRYGQLQWTRAAMGLKGCPASFARMMDMVMQGIPNVITYIDDVLIYASTPEAALASLDIVLRRLRQHNLKVNLAKSSILAAKTDYLGHTLSSEGIAPGRDKAQAILAAKPPHTVKQLKSFLGMINYFRSFVRHFAHQAGKLYALTRQDSEWKGGPLPTQALATFELLKREIANATPRKFPRREGKYHLYVDGSLGDDKEEGGLGAHLMQEEQDGSFRTIAFASRALKKHEKNYSAFLLELQAAVYAIDYFSHYLTGRVFTLYTDHAPLTKLSVQHKKTLHRLHALLNEHFFDIKHVPGKKNAVADFLSRSHGPAQPTEQEEVIASCAGDSHQDRLAYEQQNDPALGPLYRALWHRQPNPPYPSNLARWAGRIHFKGKILTITLPPRQGVPNDERPRALVPRAVRPLLLREAHNSHLGGHQGIHRTAERIRQQFWWPAMEHEVALHVRSCQTCQATSNKDGPTTIPHDVFPAEKGPNHRVHIDLFGPLKDKEGAQKFILGMTDAFTKILRLKVLSSKSAVEVAQAIWSDWMAIYGIPKTIVSDNGAEFVNQLQTEIYKLLQVKHKTTTPYHPVCNQMQEHQHRGMAHYIRTALHGANESTIDWEYYLPALMLSHNTAVNKQIKMSPFYAMFGYDARLPLWPDLSDVLKTDEFRLPPAEKDALFGWLENRQRAREAVVHNEQHARDLLPNTTLPKTTFKTGDKVWTRIQATNEKNKKFAPKWERAIVMERNSATTYKIKRLDVKSGKIKVVNAQHLKKRVEEEDRPEVDSDEEETVTTDDEDTTTDEEPEFPPSPPAKRTRRRPQLDMPQHRMETRAQRRQKEQLERPDEDAEQDDAQVAALRIQYDGKWLNLEEYIEARGGLPPEEVRQIAKALEDDYYPDYLIHRMCIPRNVPEVELPPPPPAPSPSPTAASPAAPTATSTATTIDPEKGAKNHKKGR